MPNPTSNTDQAKGRRTPPDPPRLNVIAVILLVLISGSGITASVLSNNPLGAVLGLIAAMSPRIAQQWERAVVLRLGRSTGLRGPGLFWVIPGIEQVSSWIDQ